MILIWLATKREYFRLQITDQVKLGASVFSTLVVKCFLADAETVELCTFATPHGLYYLFYTYAII